MSIVTTTEDHTTDEQGLMSPIDELLAMVRVLYRTRDDYLFTDFVDRLRPPTPETITALESRVLTLDAKAAQKWGELHLVETRIKEREAHRMALEATITQKLAELDSINTAIEAQSKKLDDAGATPAE